LSLAVPDRRGNRPLAHRSVAGKLLPRDEDVFAKAMVEPLVRRCPATATRRKEPSISSATFSAAFDRWCARRWRRSQRSCHLVGRRFHSTPAKWGARLADGDNFPWSVDQIVLPGFHTAAENSLKRGGTGDAMFLAVCGLMASGLPDDLISAGASAANTVDLHSRIRSRIAASIGRSGLAAERELAADRLLDPSLEGRLKPSARGGRLKAIIRSSVWVLAGGYGVLPKVENRKNRRGSRRAIGCGQFRVHCREPQHSRLRGHRRRG